MQQCKSLSTLCHLVVRISRLVAGDNLQIRRSSVGFCHECRADPYNYLHGAVDALASIPNELVLNVIRYAYTSSACERGTLPCHAANTG